MFFVMTDKSDPYIDEHVSNDPLWHHEPYQMYVDL
jgi:hypothetical protein